MQSTTLLTLISLLLLSPAFAADPDLRFKESGKGFTFDTGTLRGQLHANGKSIGLSDVVHVPTGKKLSRSMGLFSPYRLLDAANRYGPAAWDWPSTARLLDDGAVEVSWAADDAHPFDLRAVYRLSAGDALDLTLTVTAKRELKDFEIFLASYFDGFASAYAHTAGGLVEARKADGDWHAWVRDDAAWNLVTDGRWKRPPSPVEWVNRGKLAGPMALRRDADSGLAALVMSPPGDAFAVLMPYGEESHRSLYVSLLGKTIAPGKSATARARLVIGKVTDKEAIGKAQDFAHNGNPGRR